MSEEQAQRIAVLERQLRDRDVAAAKVTAEALAIVQAEDVAKFAAAKGAAAATELESIRRGCHLTALLAKADPKQPLDALSLAKLIPESGWPEGITPEQFNVAGIVPPAAVVDLGTTTIGRLVGKHGGIK